MMKKSTLLFTFLLPILLYGQGINTFWLLGYDSGGGAGFGTTNIDFRQNPPTIFQLDRPMNFWRTNVSISDSLGNLQFYSNGIYIANRLNDTLQNGSDFNTGLGTSIWATDGLPISQGLLVIPDPSTRKKYYVFSESVDNYSNHYLPTRLTCSYLDMGLDSSKGGLLWKNLTKINSPLCLGFLTACKHANGRDWWVTAHKYLTGGIYKLLITPLGVSTPSIQYIAHTTDSLDGLGQAVYSPDGSKYALYDALNYLQVFSFDRCLGNFSNPQFLKILDSASCGGIAFSPNSRFLYVSSTNYIYQLDTYASNILASKTTVAVWDSSYIPSFPFATTFGLMQLAPDGKIYVNSCNGTNVLHVINYPDSGGVNCDVCQHCVSLPTYNIFSIPNFPNYSLGAENGSICDTLNLSAENIGFKISAEIFHLYPNPAKFAIFVASSFNEKNNYEILNSLGFALKSVTNKSNLTQLDISDLACGIYYLKCKSQKAVEILKFVKVED